MSRMTKKEYSKYVDEKAENSSLWTNILKAFLVGGAICTIGQVINNLAIYFGTPEDMAGTVTSMTLIFIGALLTGLDIYDEIGKFGGAGSAVPITGFANSIVSPAMEFKSEGYILGVGARMFVVAGPVLVYGLTSSILYGIIYYLFRVGG